MLIARSPLLVALLIGAALAGVACADLAGAGLAHAGEPGPIDFAPLVAGNTAFAGDLYGFLKAREGNLFLSPYSIAVALAMAREGAAGRTRAQMDAVLHLPQSGATEAFGALADELEPPLIYGGDPSTQQQVPAYELATANALWGQEDLIFAVDFLRRLETAFGAGLSRVDFRDTEQARAIINAWVERETHEKIRNIVPSGLPTSDTRLVLVNAIYFKAAWLEPFNEHSTADMPFIVAADQTVTAATMQRTGEYRYGEVDDLQILELPYRGRDTSLIVVLPRATDGLPDVESRLDAAQFSRWSKSLQTRRVAVSLPKFTFTSSVRLEEALQAMGMRDAFNKGIADFSGMTTEERLFISAVLHKAFVAVDEAGTEAAAATAVMMMTTSVPPPVEPVTFRADHPFLFFIQHRPTGTVLFLGRVVDPTR